MTDRIAAPTLLTHRGALSPGAVPRRSWLLGAALLPVLWLAGCGGEPRQAQAHPQAHPTQPDAPTSPAATMPSTAPSAVCPRCLVESTSQVGDLSCRVEAAMLETPEEVMPNRVTFSLNAARPYNLHLAPHDTICQLSAEHAEIVYVTDVHGHAQIRDVRLVGHPAVVADRQGKPLLVGANITLHLDAHGLNSVELPGDSGAMLAVPTMLVENAPPAEPSAPMAGSVAVALH